ncbi:hypothetical protein WT83_28950 [Burkholderia territorii]|uniref:Uncharacterized protein n=1 Tax=Burkholderia territorii TaxID=1503055 RepID=A0A108E6E9_9BURK|nr:hypothetical protein WT83_28950 [Burkholderia territorii]
MLQQLFNFWIAHYLCHDLCSIAGGIFRLQDCGSQGARQSTYKLPPSLQCLHVAHRNSTEPRWPPIIGLPRGVDLRTE